MASVTLATITAVATNAISGLTPIITPRATTHASFAGGDSCDYGALTACQGQYEGCIESIAAGANFDYNAITSCYCNFGVDYLSCYSSFIFTQSCYTGLASYYDDDWFGTFYSTWFQDFCGSVPPMTAQANPTSIPTVVSLSFAEVTIVTANGSVPVPTYVNTPIYSGSGSLLAGKCQQTEFTLLDVGSTVFYAPFVGCVSDRPDCCPYTVATATLAVTKDTTVTVTVTATDAGGAGPQAIVAYPQPVDGAIVKTCAQDYYSVSGNCCPKNFFPFTRALAGGIPCYSSLKATTTAPTLTAGLAGQPLDKAKPTSAVVNVVWAMSYPVASSSPVLSTGAIAGIAVGGAAALGIVAFLGTWVWRTKRKNKELQKDAAAAGAAAVPGQAPPGGQGMQQVQNLPPGAPLPYDPRMSMAGTTTTGSMMAPHQTGTPSISELSSLSSGAPLVGGGPPPPQGYFHPHQGRSPSFAGSSPSPGPNGIPVPGTIAEGDEAAAMAAAGGGYAPYPQQHQPMHPQQFGQQPYGQQQYVQQHAVPPGQYFQPPQPMYPPYPQQPGMPQGPPPGVVYPPPQELMAQGQPMAYPQQPPPQGMATYQQQPPPQEMNVPPSGPPRQTGELA